MLNKKVKVGNMLISGVLSNVVKGEDYWYCVIENEIGKYAYKFTEKPVVYQDSEQMKKVKAIYNCPFGGYEVGDVIKVFYEDDGYFSFIDKDGDLRSRPVKDFIKVESNEKDDC